MPWTQLKMAYGGPRYYCLASFKSLGLEYSHSFHSSWNAGRKWTMVIQGPSPVSLQPGKIGGYFCFHKNLTWRDKSNGPGLISSSPVSFLSCFPQSQDSLHIIVQCEKEKKTSNRTEWRWTSLPEPLPLTHYTHPHWARDPKHYRAKAFGRPRAWTSISMLAGSFRNNQFNWVQMVCSLRIGKKPTVET